jgi:hypothetical protein
MSELNRFLLALLPLVIMPLLVGTAAFRQKVPPATRWFFGVVSLGLILVVSYAAGVSWNTFFYGLGIGLVGCALLCLKEGVKLWGRASRLHLYRAGGVLPLVILVGCACVKVLAEPLVAWDAITIWYDKARALYLGSPIPELPFANYPPLGPIYWALVMKFTGGLWESYGRLLFPTLYVGWIVSLREIFPEWLPEWIVLIAVTAAGWLFYDTAAFTNGYQDGFVAVCAGMAAIRFCRLLFGDRKFCERDYLLGVYFAGVGALVKNEGAILAVIVYAACLVMLVVGRCIGSSWNELRNLVPGAVLFVLLVGIWPTVLVAYGRDPEQVQGSAFTMGGIATLYRNGDRIPVICRYFAEYYLQPQIRVILGCALLSIVTAGMVPVTRKVIAFLWLIGVGHSLFIACVYLATQRPLEWHLRTSLDRLAFQHSFVYVIAVSVCVSFLLEASVGRHALACQGRTSTLAAGGLAEGSTP